MHIGCNGISKMSHTSLSRLHICLHALTNNIPSKVKTNLNEIMNSKGSSSF